MLQLYSAMRTVCPLTIIIITTIVTSSALSAPPPPPPPPPPSTATTSQTAESLFASPVMVSFLPNGDMHVITHANGFQFYVLPAKAVNLPANQVTVRSGGHQSLVKQWPVLAGSRLFQEDFSQGAVVSGFEDFGGGDDQHSQRVAFLFSPWIRYRFDTLLPASAGEDGVEVFPRLAGEQGIYLVNSGAQTLYWLEDQDGGLTKVKRVEYDTDTGRFEILAVSAICRSGGEQVVQLLKEPRGAPPPCARSPAEFGEASNGLTCGFATTGQFQGQGPVVETFYLFGAKSVLIFAHNQRLVVRALGEFFKVVDGGGGGGSSVSPSGKSSKLDPVTAILIVVGLSVLFAAVIILVGIIYCSCCACSSPSPSSSSSTTAAATKASSSSSGAKGSAQALPKHRQPKLSSKQSKKEKAEEEEEKEKTAMETAVETAAVESEEEASAAFEDQPQPQPPKAKKRSAFAGKVGFLKSTSKELVRKPKQQQKQQKQQAERASEMLPFSLTNTALSSLQTDALPVGKLSELVGQPLKQPLKQLKQKRPKQKQPKQQQQLSVTTRSRSAGKGKSRSLAKSRGQSARPKSARGGGGKTVLAGKQQPWPATATILTTAEEDDQPTVLMAPPNPKERKGKGGKVGRRGSQAHFFSSDSDVSTTRRSKSKAKSNTKKSSKGKKKQKGPKTSKNAAATSSSAATEPVAETILTAREKVVVVVDKSSSGGKSKSKAKGKGGGGGGSRNTTSTSNSTKSSSSSDGGK